MYSRSPREKSPCEYKESNDCNKDWNCLWDYDVKECRKKSTPVHAGEYSGALVFNPTQLNLSSIKNIYSFMNYDIIDMYYSDPDAVLESIESMFFEDQEIVRLLNYLPDEETWFIDELVEIVDHDLILESGNWNMIKKIIPQLTSINALIIPITRGGHIGILKYFIEMGLTINYNYTLRIAADNGHLDIVQYLVSLGADIHADNDAALLDASQNGHLDVVQYLVSKGANIHVEDDFALRRASMNRHLDVVQYLVSVGADIHAADDQAIRAAAFRGHLDVVQYLVSMGANVHARNDDALVSAASNGHLDVVKYLVSVGANVHADNDKALQLALLHDHLDIVQYLQNLA